MKKIETKKPLDPNAKKILISFRVNAEEMRQILAKAHQHADGKPTVWARWAALNAKGPKK